MSNRYKNLEAVIDAVAESYDEPWPINSLASTALPNRRRAVQALLHLEHVLLMGFFATRELNEHNLRYGIAEHLYPAHDLLVVEIERALRYKDWYGRCEDCPPAGSGEAVAEQVLEALPDLRRKLHLDLKAAFEGDPAADSVEEIVFAYPSVKAIMAYRLAHELWKQHVPLIPRIWTEHAHGRTGIDLHPGAKIGESFFVDHGTGTVVGETAVLGDNVKLYQGVTLGALSVPRRGQRQKRHPTLEDDVTVYAGATILGGETVVGRGSVIGGNQWVIASVPPGSKVFGGKKTGGEGTGGK